MKRMKQYLLYTALVILYLSIIGNSNQVNAQSVELDSLIQVIENPSLPVEDKINVSIRLSTLYYCGKNAEKYASNALNIALKQKNEILLADAWTRWSWMKGCIEEFDSAKIYREKAFRIYEANNHNKGKIRIYLNQAMDFQLAQYEFDVINQIFEKAYHAGQQLNKDNLETRCTILNNWSVFLIKYKKYKLGEKKLKEALKIAKPINDIPIQGRLRFNLGRVYQLNNQPYLAIDYYLEAYKIRKQDDNIGAISETLMRLSELMIEARANSIDTLPFQKIRDELGINDEVSILDTVIQYIKPQGSSQFLKDAYEVKIKAYLQREDYKNAFLLLKEVKRLSENQILSEENLETLVSIESRYENERLANEVLKSQLEKEQSQTQRNYLLIALIALIIIAMLGYLYFQQNIRKRQLQLAVQQQEMKDLKNQQQIFAMNAMLEGQEKERARIAKDLHDGLGSLLTSVKHNILKINDSNHSKTDAELLIDEACSEVRRIAHNMMPHALKQLGLHQAIEDLCQQVDQVQSFEVIFQSFGEVLRLPENKEVMIFRAVQEAFNNIQKHSNANEVIVQITYGEDWLNLTIEDDGVGFDKKTDNYEAGLGLHSIISRIEYIDGECLIESEKGEGTSISISLNLEKELVV